MKRTLILILIILLLAGCASAPVEQETPTSSPIVTEPVSTPTETIPLAKVSFTLYLPDENAEHFLETTIETDQITAEGVLKLLQEHDVMPDSVALNSFSSEGSQLIMDFNQAFGDLVCSTGTAGELMITGSVFNTFLNAFQADSIVFTVEGEILESGHVIYDFPITHMD